MKEPMEIDEIIDMVPLDDSTNKLAQDIVAEQNVDKVKDLVHLFNLNQAKKNVLRVFKYNALLDKLSDAALNRVEKHSDEFSNADLVSWMQVAQTAIDRANKSLNLVDETPAIQINQQVNNIKVEEPLDRESRSKIRQAVSMILAKAKENKIVEDADLSDSEPITIVEDPEIDIDTDMPGEFVKLKDEEDK